MASGRKSDSSSMYFTGNSGKIPQTAIAPGLDALSKSIQGVKDMVNSAKQKGLATAIADDAVSFSSDVLKAMTGSKATVSDSPPSSVLKGLAGTAKDIIDSGTGTVSSRGSGSGSSFASASTASQASKAQGKSLEQIINETVDKNNAWAAEQAQKQMDFQLMMSNTAHQRELEDLKAAGLNPVLSVSGGNGASMGSGAMAQPDTSNTRLLAEMSLGSMEALGNSAVQLASVSNSKASNSFAGRLLNVASKYFIPAVAKGAASALTRGLFG